MNFAQERYIRSEASLFQARGNRTKAPAPRCCDQQRRTAPRQLEEGHEIYEQALLMLETNQTRSSVVFEAARELIEQHLRRR
jgi:hypothetical protein